VPSGDLTRSASRRGLFFASFVFSKTQCQTPSLSSTVNIPSNSNLQTKKDYLDYLSTKYGWTFSYNASQLNVDGAIRLPNQISSIQSVLEQIFPENELQITFQQPKKIILQTKGLKQKTYFLSGNITDKVSGESIFGAIIIDNNSGKQVLSNEKGYYIMELPKGNVDLEIDYIAYKKNKQIITIDRDVKLNFELENDNLLDTIRIQNEFFVLLAQNRLTRTYFKANHKLVQSIILNLNSFHFEHLPPPGEEDSFFA